MKMSSAYDEKINENSFSSDDNFILVVNLKTWAVGIWKFTLDDDVIKQMGLFGSILTCFSFRRSNIKNQIVA